MSAALSIAAFMVGTGLAGIAGALTGDLSWRQARQSATTSSSSCFWRSCWEDWAASPAPTIGAFVVGLVQSFSGLLLPLQLQNVMLFVVFVAHPAASPAGAVRLASAGVRNAAGAISSDVNRVGAARLSRSRCRRRDLFRDREQITDFYLSRLAALIAFWAALGMTWNLIGGYAGQLSLGHAAFVGLGGYITFVLQQ